MDYTVSSSRILRDSQGHSRGVGFARYVPRNNILHMISYIFTYTDAVA